MTKFLDIEKITRDSLLTSSRVGTLLQVNPSSVNKWIEQGLIIAFRTPGGHRRVRASDLVEFLESHKMPVPQELESASRRRLLLVDDDTAQLNAMGRVLKAHRDEVELVKCTNGIDALVQVGSFRPHLVVIDMYMPEVDGLEVCRRLKQNPETRDLGVVITSGHLTAEVKKSAAQAGALSCIEKPIDVNELLGLLGIRKHPER